MPAAVTVENVASATYKWSCDNAAWTISGDGTASIGLYIPASGTATLTVKVIGECDTATRNISITAAITPPEGIDDYTAKGNIRIYPNPTSGQLRITNYELRENTVIEIFDVYGKKHVSQFTFHNSLIEIDISHLVNGIYFMKMDGKTVKIVKQ